MMMRRSARPHGVDNGVISLDLAATRVEREHCLCIHRAHVARRAAYGAEDRMYYTRAMCVHV